jgi:hypothetical protein
VDSRRAIATFIAFCIGAAIGMVALYNVRAPSRTGVAPIEIKSESHDEEDRRTRKSLPRDKHGGADAGHEQGGEDRPRREPRGGDRGAGPVPPPAPVPSGDDAEGSGDDGGEGERGGDR